MGSEQLVAEPSGLSSWFMFYLLFVYLQSPHSEDGVKDVCECCPQCS